MPKILCIQYYLPSETKADVNALGFYCFSCVICHEYELMSPVSIVFIGTSYLPGVPCRHLTHSLLTSTRGMLQPDNQRAICLPPTLFFSSTSESLRTL
ncbi:hypothetical protein AVEN_159181-1 [Araneus ventricosus]|uniref:Uncharacterized protein n=1 Tax=Araneus ventricosus TaxID=182803 RepID=A0A4Y2U702_ARAVE|nr:hypothetical protein AVEN_70812-1 [Araneus ventricosus]GBO08714.1 hypothetical protein AVEN_64975-1 [Araneus ventricosus]GBO08723.1 hypothetical protein AVEN_2294-1 [Araneus ventricosus]GBO08789.1 hypothetical protein AVEN_159181-1 [Araneus ventricosus]